MSRSGLSWCWQGCPLTEQEVVIPFYGKESGPRWRNFGFVVDLYDDRGWRTISPMHCRSLSHARNKGAEWSHYSEVLVFNDGDTLCPPEQLDQAVELAAAEPGLVFPFDTYLRLSQQATGRLNHWTEVFSAAVEQEMFEPPSVGVVAISRACFEQVGGFDEGFVGWGYEDIAFRYACSKLWPERRVPGDGAREECH